jgi:LysR family transcriptional activator of nhaA
MRARAMDDLNYNHLLYFHIVAREGSIRRAAEVLRLTQSTVSIQVHALERSIGQRLFTRSGRHLVLTDVGQLVRRYAEEIFARGDELAEVLRGRPAQRPMRFAVGIASTVTKLVAFRLLEPVFRLAEPMRIVCGVEAHEALLGRLAAYSLDLVISDAPVAAGSKIRAFGHALGDSGISFFGDARLAARYRRGFPRSLDGAPVLLPADGCDLRRGLDGWFDALGVHPQVVGEFEDSAAIKVFGASGAGIFPVPSIVAAEMRRQYRVCVVGKTDEVRERYYAISVERRLRHPAVVAISESARRRLETQPS